jgi:hypothetical protein
MVTAARVDPRWIDPDRVRAGTGQDSTAPADENVAPEDCQIDRFHNHENLSPEALAQAVTQLQASVSAMTDRLAALETAEGASLNATRRLGLDVIELAGALARRVRALEQPDASGAGAKTVVEETAPLDLAPVAEIAPTIPVEAASPGEAEEPTPPFLFVQQPTPRQKPANGPVIALGILLVIAAAAAIGGAWYYRSQSHPPVRARTAPAPVKLITTKPAHSDLTIATSPPAVAQTHKIIASKTASGNSASADAPTGHVLYGVDPATAPNGKAPSALTPAKP